MGLGACKKRSRRVSPLIFSIVFFGFGIASSGVGSSLKENKSFMYITKRISK